jgi:hypothetical protein
VVRLACTGSRPAATEHTCTSGDTPVPTGTVREFEDGNTGATVITGSFDPGARSYIEFSPVSLGAARNGPYRSFYSEIGMVDDDAAGWGYPKRGIEVEVSSGVESDQARYDSFFPTPPYRLYPDGWAWSIPSPGAPLGVQLVDAEAEDRLRSRSKVAGAHDGRISGSVRTNRVRAAATPQGIDRAGQGAQPS